MTSESDSIEADINRSRHALNDTIEALGGKLTPGQMVDEAMGLLQGQAGQFSSSIGRQLRDNPLPLLLFGAGAALFFFQRSKTSAATRSPMESDAWNDGADEGFGSPETEPENIGSSTDGARGSSAQRSRGRFASVSGAPRHEASGINEFMRAKAGDAKHFTGDLKRKAESFYDANPLAVGVIGLAIGAAAGSAIRLSGVERDNLKPLADAATQEGSKLIEKGSSMAQGMVETASAAKS